ncbi:MAG: hypothetical protein JRJ78_03110 [Deltaproteobacteria bacterium]|nr:hypothetical protein [Deltaproteobacteria bacterium]
MATIKETGRVILPKGKKDYTTGHNNVIKLDSTVTEKGKETDGADLFP